MSKKRLIYTKDLCDFVLYLYALKEKTNWQRRVFKSEHRHMYNKVWEVIKDNKYEDALTDGFDDFCESAIIDYLNPHFIKYHQGDSSLKAMVRKASELAPLETFMGWVKYVALGQKQSIFVKKCSWSEEAIDHYSHMFDSVGVVSVIDEDAMVKIARSSEVGRFLMYLRPDFVATGASLWAPMKTAYATMVSLLSKTQAMNKPDEVVVGSGPVGVLYTAILISEISKSVDCTLSELISRTIELSARYRNKDKSETYSEVISVPLCISWLLTNGYSLRSSYLVYKIGPWHYTSSAAAAAAHTFNNKKLLSDIARLYLLKSNVLNVENQAPSFDVKILMSTSVESTNAAMSIVSVFKLDVDAQRADYHGYKYEPHTADLVPHR